MKSLFFIFLVSIVSLVSFGQSLDSIPAHKMQQALILKPFIIPTALIAGGVLLLQAPENEKLQTNIRTVFGADFQTKADNFLQYEAVLQIYGGKHLGFKPKNDVLHQSLHLVVANAIMGGIVQVMKISVNEERPDGTDNKSFPSGHTGTAFTNASLLFYEFKDTNIWYASSGFLFATATGVLRIANNKHRTSDVLAGAGIGLAVGTLVSYWNPFKSFSLGKNKTHALLYPQIGNNYGIGLLLQK